jgi:hypothetical protein
MVLSTLFWSYTLLAVILPAPSNDSAPTKYLLEPEPNTDIPYHPFKLAVVVVEHTAAAACPLLGERNHGRARIDKESLRRSGAMTGVFLLRILEKWVFTVLVCKIIP